MNLESLRALKNAPAELSWNGQPIYLRKLGARDGVELYDGIRSKEKAVASGEDDHMATVKFHVNIISRSVCDASGKLCMDTDEAKSELENLSFDLLVSLGELVLSHSGFGGEKKS